MFDQEQLHVYQLPLEFLEWGTPLREEQQTRAKFFDDARGSASESAACLDALVAKRLCSSDRIRHGKEILERVYSMLTKLVERFDRSSSSPSSSSSHAPPRTKTTDEQPTVGGSLR